MPNYDYQCIQCGHQEEILQKITAESLTICPQCHQSTFKRKIGRGIGLQFQGSGFYSTDYSNKASENSSESSKSAESSSPTSKGCGCGKTSCSN